MNNVEFTNPVTNEKFIHRGKKDDTVNFYYGPKDASTDKKHDHAVFDQLRNVVFIRNPKGE